MYVRIATNQTPRPNSLYELGVTSSSEGNRQLE